MKNDIQSAARMIDRVSAKIKTFEEQYRKTGEKYNIFDVAEIERKEVIVCRVIADLLNPKGFHYRGDAYLQLFMDTVVKPHIKQAQKLDISKTNVEKEYHIPGDNGDRRIDIVIDDGSVFIPIEAKIYAGDQEKQVADYAAFSRKRNTAGFIPVLFLTLDGHKPSNAKAGDFVCVSFAKHIIPWLEKCLRLPETDNAAPVREILKQFIRAIKLLCNHMEDEKMENTINSLITQSDNSYMAALRIKQAFDSLQDSFDQKVREIFEHQILKLVKVKFSDAEYIPDEEKWWYIEIPIKNKFDLEFNYDWKKIFVGKKGKNGRITKEEISNIRDFMFNETHCRLDKGYGGPIWVSEHVKFPGLENTEDSAYLYQLYKIYSKSPKSVADRIIAIAKALEDLG